MSQLCIENTNNSETDIEPIEVNATIQTKNETKIPPNICPQNDQKSFQKNLAENLVSTKLIENFNNAYGDMVLEFKNMVVKQKAFEEEINAKNEMINVLKRSQAESEFELEQYRKKLQRDITIFKNIEKKVKKEIETYWNSEIKSKIKNLNQNQLDLKSQVSSKIKEISELKNSIDNLRSVDLIVEDLKSFNSDSVRNLKLEVTKTVHQFSIVKEKYRNLGGHHLLLILKL